MAFLQFQGSDPNLKWGRADYDGLPLKHEGNNVPLLRDEEFEAVTEVVSNCCWGTFDTENIEEKHFNRTYKEVLEGITLHWFKLIHRQHLVEKVPKRGGGYRRKVKVYIEWAEPTYEINQDKLKQVVG